MFYQGQSVSDDEWCPDCGESLPCGCGYYEDDYETDEDGITWISHEQTG